MDYTHDLIDILKKYNLTYSPIDNNESLIKIYNLFDQNIIFEPKTSCELLYLAKYHNHITKNYGEMEKYYLMAIEKGNTEAMRNFSIYHKTITKDYNQMAKYYLMSVQTEYS